MRIVRVIVGWALLGVGAILACAGIAWFLLVGAVGWHVLAPLDSASRLSVGTVELVIWLGGTIVPIGMGAGIGWFGWWLVPALKQRASVEQEW